MTSLPAWSPTEAVSPDRARSLLVTRFPLWEFGEIEVLGVGWDNVAYLVPVSGLPSHPAIQTVFRFPQRELGGRLMQSEINMLPRLVLLPIPIPDLQFIGEPGPDYPYPFMGYPLMPGVPSEHIALTDAQRQNNAAALGQFLAALHSFDQALVLAWNPPSDPVGKLDIELRNPKALEHIEQLADHLDSGVRRKLAAILHKAPNTYRSKSSCIVHGDLYARHLLADSSGEIVGVIDWGDVHLGDPAVDLMMCHQFLPVEAHASFLSAYGYVDELTWMMARLRAIWHALTVLIYALEIKDQPLALEFTSALNRISVADS